MNAQLEIIPREGALVLNVNDNDAARYVITRMLEVAGFVVVEAMSGHDALEKIRKLNPGLVVLDINLPDLDGMEICRQVKADPETQRVKILHTSAVFIAAEAKVQSLNSGADGYLSSPFEQEELIATARSLLRLLDAEQKLRDTANELADASRRKSEFLATLAHELRNPLAPILNGLEVLKVTEGKGEIASRAREMMERQLRQMVRLIDDLLDVSRVSRGKIDLRRERVDLALAVQNAVEISRPLIERARHELTVDLPHDPVVVYADVTRLAQVFANLLNNAAKYTRHGGRISLGVTQTAREVAIVVRDNGIGIQPHLLPKLFDIFMQVDHSLEKTHGGLGIGLSIAKQLIELHGGRIEAASEGLGKGSQFTVFLPLAENHDVS
jgi:two-component system, sensor histidine kinase